MSALVVSICRDLKVCTRVCHPSPCTLSSRESSRLRYGDFWMIVTARLVVMFIKPFPYFHQLLLQRFSLGKVAAIALCLFHYRCIDL